MQKLNDEKILGALLAAGSVRKAAEIADVSEATIRNRLNDEAFRIQYEKAKAAVLSEACDAISARLTLAVDTLCEVLDSTETAATVRVSAADSLLRHGFPALWHITPTLAEGEKGFLWLVAFNRC